MEERIKLMLGDNMKSLKELPDNSVDSIVTDPPYALTSIKKRFGKEGSAPAQYGSDGAFQRSSKGFMGKEWDAEVPTVEFWSEVYRVLKPGGHVLSFGGTRTYHRMAVNIEDAGFEIRDQIMWIYGSGFPKSHNISKAIDKKYGRLGYDLTEIKTKLKDLYKSSGKTMSKIDEECGFKASGYLRIEHRDDDGWGEALPTEERWKVISEVIGCSQEIFNEYSNYFVEAEREITGKGNAGFLEKNNVFEMDNEGYGDYDLTKSKTPEGQEWEGWGTALKPANEPICVARKPLSEKSVAENVLKWGTGGINIDDCRIGSSEKLARPINEANNNVYGKYNTFGNEIEPEGRFPANVIFDEEAGKILDEQSGIKQSQKRKPEYNKPTEHTNTYTPKASDYRDDNTYDDKGGASRFFYVPKVSKKERNRGLDGFEEKVNKFGNQKNGEDMGNKSVNDKFTTQPKKNNHPTVKPINLLTYLIRLVTPKNGVVMDCFMGSGSTGIAAQLEGFKFIGMEMDEDYFNIAETRINAYEEYRELLK